MNGSEPQPTPQPSQDRRLPMILALRKMIEAVEAGQIAHVVVIGLQPSGGYSMVSQGPGAVNPTAIIGAIGLTKATIEKQVLAAMDQSAGCIVRAAAMPV